MKKNKVLKLIARDGNFCHYCKREFGEDLASRTMDHVIPIIKGGTNHVDNMVLSCKRCNRWKGRKDYDYFVTQCLPNYLKSYAVDSVATAC